MHKEIAEALLANQGLNELSVDAQAVTHALLAVAGQLEELVFIASLPYVEDEE